MREFYGPVFDQQFCCVGSVTFHAAAREIGERNRAVSGQFNVLKISAPEQRLFIRNLAGQFLANPFGLLNGFLLVRDGRVGNLHD